MLKADQIPLLLHLSELLFQLQKPCSSLNVAFQQESDEFPS